MTPQERDLVTGLFDRLASLENTPRDPEAERLIIEGLRRAPNAVYALVQTALVQDEALKHANTRIVELEDQLGMTEPPRDAGFLGGMRNALFGRQDGQRATSVPSVSGGAPGYGPSSGYGAGAGPGGYGAQYGQQPAPGGSFLGTAAATAAGMIGGSLMLNSIRSMMGNKPGGFSAVDQAHAAPRDTGTPWTDSSNSTLARDAGVNDIGRDSGTAAHDSGSGGGLFGLFGGGNDDEAADDDGDEDDSGNFDGDDC